MQPGGCQASHSLNAANMSPCQCVPVGVGEYKTRMPLHSIGASYFLPLRPPWCLLPTVGVARDPPQPPHPSPPPPFRVWFAYVCVCYLVAALLWESLNTRPVSAVLLVSFTYLLIASSFPGSRHGMITARSRRLGGQQIQCVLQRAFPQQSSSYIPVFLHCIQCYAHCLLERGIIRQFVAHCPLHACQLSLLQHAPLHRLPKSTSNECGSSAGYYACALCYKEKAA